MPLRFLLDEHLRGGVLWHAIRQHNALGVNTLDVVRVGDPPDPPLGSLDPDILRWAEVQGRILVSLDIKSLPGHLAPHLHAGNHSPGIFIIRMGSTVPEVVDYLALAAYAGDRAIYQDGIDRIP